MTAGVPQGSVLSPTLFNIFVYDLPSPNHILTAQYADDTAYLYRGKCKDHMLKKIQSALDALEEWTLEWQISINPDKSQAIYFSWRHSVPAESLTFGDSPIPWTDTVKYLGLTMDRKLTWEKHITSILKKANQTFGQLKALLLPISKLPLRRRIHLYKAIIRPKMTYGSPAWITLSNTQLNRLQTRQNIMIRRIVGAPPYVSNVQLRNDTKTPSLSAFISQLALSQSSKFDLSLLQDHLEPETPDENGARRRKQRRPLHSAARRDR